MWKLAFIAVALAVSFSPADAREDRPREASPPAGDLRRDVERISREIYRPRPSGSAPKQVGDRVGVIPKKR